MKEKLKIFESKKKIFSRVSYSRALIGQDLVKILTHVKPSVVVKFSPQASILPTFSFSVHPLYFFQRNSKLSQRNKIDRRNKQGLSKGLYFLTPLRQTNKY